MTKTPTFGSETGGSVLGVIAGGGQAPRQLLEACDKRGRACFVLCLKGQADEDLGAGRPHEWLSLGEGAHLRDVVQKNHISELVMLGRVRRPSLVELKPDWVALKVLTKIGMNSLGDDALLQAVGKAVEQVTGARVIGAHEIFADLLTPEGVLTQTQPDEMACADIKRGAALARAIGQLDVGQAVVVQQGLVLGVEAIEGTDALVKRSGALQRDGEGGVLVKMAKPQQDHRYDLPTIGPDSIAVVAAAGLRGIAIEAGQSLLVEREKTIAAADAAGLFIVGAGSSWL